MIVDLIFWISGLTLIGLGIAIGRRSKALRGIAVLAGALVVGVMILANGKKEPEFVFFPCVLDGQIVGSPLLAIDLVIDETARRADTSDDRVGPDELLHTGIARQVVFRQRRFYMNGPFMASEPSHKTRQAVGD